MDISASDGAGSPTHWCVGEEVDWGRIDITAARGDAELLMMVRRAALRAARRTVGLSHLLSALAADSVASALFAREIHDSWKHFHALRSYLDVTEYAPAIADAELDQHRRAAPEGALKRSEDVGARIAQLLDDAARDGAVFALIGGRAPDPALSRLAERIAADRERHALALASYLSKASREIGDRTA